MAGNIRRIARRLRRHPAVRAAGRLRRTPSALKRRAGRLKPSLLLENRRVGRQYTSSLRQATGWRRDSGTSAAVVVHLYYTDAWPLFRERLSRLSAQMPFDLYVTLPVHNQAFASQLQADLPGCRIFVTPNRGRDVLPFMQLLPVLDRLGYKYLLKIHSKKSTHRTDGQDWLAGMIDDLLPTSGQAVQDLARVLDQPDTGIVGPSGQYVSLTVNFEANGTHMTTILSKIYDTRTAHQVLQTDRRRHGFFAGTMFWARLDALRPIMAAGAGYRRFEPEQGQIDATLAHALERTFCLISQIEGRKLYEIGDGLHATAYGAGTVPDWSKVYIGPKPAGD